VCSTKCTYEEVINKEMSWTFFDGASQGTPLKEGLGEYYISTLSTISLLRLGWAMKQTTFVN
jgi:hypothetical protein